MLEHLWSLTTEGMTYDVEKAVVSAIISTVMGLLIMRTLVDKLKTKKDMLYFSGALFVGMFLIFSYLAPRVERPNLVGGIQQAITGKSPDGLSAIELVTISVLNTGNMQTIIKQWSVKAETNGETFVGTFVPMPDSVTFTMPDLGPTFPSAITYHKEDDILLKSITPVQPGALISGTMYVIFPNVDPMAFKNGAKITVTYEDILSYSYSSSVQNSAKFSNINMVPGLHTDMICRVPPLGTQQQQQPQVR